MKLLGNYAEAAEKINSMIDQSLVEPELEYVSGGDEEDDESSVDQDFEDEIYDEDDVIVHHDLKISEDHDFDKEFSKLVAESLDQRKVEKKISAFDTPIPFKMKRTNVESNESQVSFTLLTKRGNKPQVFFIWSNQQSKQFALPTTNTLVLNTLLTKAADLKEKEELKKIVLSYEDNDSK